MTDRISLLRRIEAAQGKIDCDLILKNAWYLDVFSCQWRQGELAIVDGAVVSLEPGLSGKRQQDLKGKWVVPGFIDAHVHLESSLMTPSYFQEAVLPRGTTTAVSDPHELANVLGPSGIQYFLDSSERLDLDLWVMLSSCVPATDMETNGGGEITAEDLATWIHHPKTLGLAEMMNVSGVLNGDPEILKKLQLFQDRPKDGHFPLAQGHSLSAYAAAGLSSCHESSELKEAQLKLTQGISIWMREGSVAKDLNRLLPLLNLATSSSIGFCTDDRNPLDIAQEGHMDHLVRSAIRAGVSPEVVFRSASWSVARHYGLTSGFRRWGAIAPGYQADLVVLDDVETCTLQNVLKGGRWVSEISRPSDSDLDMSNTIQVHIPESRDLEAVSGRVNVIGVLEGKIITEHRIKQSDDRGVARLSVLERYGNGHPPANGYVEGFGENLQGAIASSVGHDSHNLIVVGSDASDMRVALAALAEVGGGFCVVRNGDLLARLPLPQGGLMSKKTPEELKQELQNLKQASRSIGCELHEPFLQLAFLSLPVIPSLKLTDRGLVDVNAFKLIDVRAT